MRRKAKHYTLEFKQKAVELSYAKGSVAQVCEDLDILPAVLYRWRKEQKNYGKNSFPGRGNPKMTDEQTLVLYAGRLVGQSGRCVSHTVWKVLICFVECCIFYFIRTPPCTKI